MHTLAHTHAHTHTPYAISKKCLSFQVSEEEAQSGECSKATPCPLEKCTFCTFVFDLAQRDPEEVE